MHHRPLTRKDRVLPADTDDIVARCGPCKAVFLAYEDHPKLYEHCDLYWRTAALRKERQRHCLQTVGSTRVSTRCVAFPSLSLSACEAEASTSPTLPQQPSTTGWDSQGAAAGRDRSQSATPRVARPVLSDPTLPRLTALRYTVRLLAPYERLACPSLLYSPLLAPLVHAQPPPIATLPHPQREAPFTPSHRGGHSFPFALYARPRVVAALRLAVAAGVPAQEALLLLSLSTVYFDVRIGFTEEGATRELQGVQENGDAAAVHEGDAPSFLEWRRILPDAPGSYQEMQRRLATLLDSFTTSSCAHGGEPHSFAASPASSSMADLHSSPLSPNPALALLQLAAQEWEERRALTVTPLTPLGCHASPLVVRDLSAVNIPPPLVVDPSASKAPSSPQKRGRGQRARGKTTRKTARTTNKAGLGKACEDGTEHNVDGPKIAVRCETAKSSTSAVAEEKGPTESSAALLHEHEHEHTVSQRRGGHRRQLQAGTPSESRHFTPYEDHDTPRVTHGLRLPALPQDPLLVYFLPVWQRVLSQCITHPEKLRTLREVLLVEAGRRCGELVVLAQEAQSHTRALAITSRLKKDPREEVSRSLPRHLHNASFRLLAPLSVQTTSFCFYGPTSEGQWRWHHPLCWRGFTGKLARCGIGAGSSSPRSPPPTIEFSDFVLQGAPRIAVGHATVDPATALFVSSASRSQEHLVTTAVPPSLLPTSEELADVLCRLGISLLPSPVASHTGAASPVTAWATAALAQQRSGFEALMSPSFAFPVATFSPLHPSTQSSVVVLPKHVAQLALEVFARELFGVHLACRKERLQELRLRLLTPTLGAGAGSMRGREGEGSCGASLAAHASPMPTLLFLSGAGREIRIGTPEQVCAEAFDVLRRTCNDPSSTTETGMREFSTAASLRYVSEGGLAEACALVTYIRKRPNSILSALPVREKLTSQAIAIAASSPLLPPASTATRSQTKVAAHVTVIQLRRSEESVLLRILACHPLAHQIYGCGVAQLVMDAAHGTLLIQRRCGQVASWLLRDCYTTARGPSAAAGGPSQPGRSVLRTPAVVVRSPHPLPLPEELATLVQQQASGGHVTSHHAPRTCEVVERDGFLAMLSRHCMALLCSKESLLPPPLATATRDQKDSSAACISADSVPSGPCDTTAMQAADPNDPESAPDPFPMRSLLCGADRAAALYVVQHHVHFHTQLRGCGFADAFAVVLPVRRGDTSAGGRATRGSLSPEASSSEGTDNDDEEEEVGEEKPQENHHISFGGRKGAATSSWRTRAANEAAAATAAAVAPSWMRSWEPGLVLQRVCGSFVQCDWDSCFDTTSGQLHAPWVVQHGDLGKVPHA